MRRRWRWPITTTLTDEDLIPGVLIPGPRIVNAAFIVEQLASGVATLEWW